MASGNIKEGDRLPRPLRIPCQPLPFTPLAPPHDATRRRRNTSTTQHERWLTAEWWAQRIRRRRRKARGRRRVSKMRGIPPLMGAHSKGYFGSASTAGRSCLGARRDARIVINGSIGWRHGRLQGCKYKGSCRKNKVQAHVKRCHPSAGAA